MLETFNGLKGQGLTCAGNSLSGLTEQEILLRFLNGDLEAFEPIYSRFKKPILKFIMKQIHSVDVAEELCQDVFLKIYHYRKTYNAEYEFSGWIWTIARNTVFDYLRQHQIGEPISYHFEPSSQETAESIIIEELEKRKLEELMKSLCNRQKEAILLRLVNCLSYEEISKSMNLSLSAVKSLINRAKSTMVRVHMEVSAEDSA